MIIWLASYPRSGNTLLRLVLGRCFGLPSYEGSRPEHAVRPEATADRPAWEKAREFYGNRFPDGDRDGFLARARATAGPVLIKTHERPCDDSPAIYVVRDGRSVLQSYTKFHQTYHGGRSSFLSLLLGDDPFGDWTSHYEAWCEQRSGPLLLVRFEELVTAGPELLARLSAFIGHTGDITPWVNPQAELQELVPAFFGDGKPNWEPDAFWTPQRLRQFYTLHGELLKRLGYVDADELCRHAPDSGGEWAELAQVALAHSRRRVPIEARLLDQAQHIRHLEATVRWLEARPVYSRVVQVVRRWTEPLLSRA